MEPLGEQRTQLVTSNTKLPHKNISLFVSTENQWERQLSMNNGNQRSPKWTWDMEQHNQPMELNLSIQIQSSLNLPSSILYA